MFELTQNRKIAVAAIIIFLVSFSTLAFFLSRAGGDISAAQTDVIHNSSGNTEEDEAGNDVSGEGEEKHVYSFMEYVAEMQEPLFVTNEEGLIQYANKEFCDIMNLDCEEIKNNSIFDYVNSKDVSDFAAVHGKIIHDGEKMDGIGPFRILKEKKELLLLLKAEPVLDDDDKVEYVIFCVKDITEQAEELNNKGANSVDAVDKDASVEEGEDDDSKVEEDDESWLENLYPNIEELKKGGDGRFMVKIGA